MRIFRSRTAASLAALAALSMTATPVFARGYDGWHHRPHRHGVDGGSLLAGLLLGGAVVAIASAASKSSQAQDTRDARTAYPGGPVAGEPADTAYTEVPPVSGYGGAEYPGGPRAGANFDGAVDACTSEIERGSTRIGSVDSVRQMSGRYSVEGHLQDGRGYACSVDETGRIRSVAVDGHAMI